MNKEHWDRVYFHFFFLIVGGDTVLCFPLRFLFNCISKDREKHAVKAMLPLLLLYISTYKLT